MLNRLAEYATLLGGGIVIGFLIARGEWLELGGGILMLGILFAVIAAQGRRQQES